MPSLPGPRDLREYFLPYQIAWIVDPSPVSVAEKSRRIGWTYASAFRAVERRLRLGTDLFYSSADLSAAREFIEECQRWARVCKVVATDLGEEIIDEKEGLTAFVLRFENGARIVAGSSNPKFFRSKGGDADADEFAFHAQPRELYKAMQPTALMWGHQLRLWSTHNGEGSFFNRLLQSTRAGRNQSDRGIHLAAPSEESPVTGQSIRQHRITLIDAVEQGLVERIKRLPAPDISARQRFIEDIRSSCTDEDSWNEEYLCQPSSEQSSLLSYALIQSCEVANLRLIDIEDLGLSGSEGAADAPNASFCAGFDVGRKHDRSVLWVMEKVADVFWTRIVRVLGDATFTAQEELLHTLMRNRAVRRLCIDSTGIGAMLAERLATRLGSRVEAIHFSAPVKAELAMPLLRLFQDRLVRLPADPGIREDLHKVRRIVTAANQIRFDADRDANGHADRFWALALAHHAADRERPRLPSPVLRKPVGW